MVHNTFLYLHDGRKLISSETFRVVSTVLKNKLERISRDLEAVHKQISDSMDKACFVYTDTNFRNAQDIFKNWLLSNIEIRWL